MALDSNSLIQMNSQEISQWFRNFTDDFTDFRIPSALSNEENKFLEENIEAKTKELSNIQLDINENLDRIQMIENHQKNIQDELEMIQVLFFPSYESYLFYNYLTNRDY